MGRGTDIQYSITPSVGAWYLAAKTWSEEITPDRVIVRILLSATQPSPDDIKIIKV